MGSTNSYSYAATQRTVLAISGSERNLSRLHAFLERFQYKVFTAGHTAEALGCIVENHPALLIADLPEAAGLGLLTQVRERTGARLPVVFAVSSCDAALESRYLDYGAACCIGKPVQPEELFHTVQMMLEMRPRTNIRIGTKLAVSVNNEAMPASGEMCSVHLSELGMYLPVERPIAKSMLSLGLRVRDRTITTRANVLYSCDGRTGGPPAGVGLKFIDLAAEDKKAIRAYILEEVMRGLDTGPIDPWSR